MREHAVRRHRRTHVNHYQNVTPAASSSSPPPLLLLGRSSSYFFCSSLRYGWSNTTPLVNLCKKIYLFPAGPIDFSTIGTHLIQLGDYNFSQLFCFCNESVDTLGQLLFSTFVDIKASHVAGFIEIIFWIVTKNRVDGRDTLSRYL